jgi:hypothetical protein
MVEAVDMMTAVVVEEEAMVVAEEAMVDTNFFFTKTSVHSSVLKGHGTRVQYEYQLRRKAD